MLGKEKQKRKYLGYRVNWGFWLMILGGIVGVIFLIVLLLGHGGK